MKPHGRTLALALVLSATTPILIRTPATAVTPTPASGPDTFSQTATSLALIPRLIELPLPLSFDEAGRIKADPKQWKRTKEEDGTELFESRTGPETRAAAIRGKDGKLESLTGFTLAAGPATKADESKRMAEQSRTVFFKEGQIAALTRCEDSAAASSIGRICVTATADLCRNLKRGETIPAETLKAMDLYEMRALAIILTLRGEDHQLDNILRYGNRLGLKSALQTTKGQLMSLAKQLQKELAIQRKSSRDPAVKKVTEKAKSKMIGGSRGDPVPVRTILETSLPRLKESCVATGFSPRNKD